MNRTRRRGVLTAAAPLCLFALACAGPSAESHASASRAPAAQISACAEPNDSGGPLRPDQACFDVGACELAVRVDPATRSLAGRLTMHGRCLTPAPRLSLDLDRALQVESVEDALAGRPLDWERAGDRITIEAAALLRAPGAPFALRVRYGGVPRPAPRAPWEGGFTWSQTPAGEPWIATTCQGEGADLWWPCKDHPSDKPESMDLIVTVPAGLVCATNGRRTGESPGDELGAEPERWTTSRWRVSTPIANYCVALNIGPYAELADDLASCAGDTIPVRLWVLRGHEEQGRALLRETESYLRWFEELCGPYPFRADKCGIVETPHLGMEHQTIIAYGNGFRIDPQTGYDWLLHHEMSHEWWANLVTASDWKDFWIHEGIGTYMQALYLERTRGVEARDAKLAADARRILNAGAIAPRDARSSDAIYVAKAGTDAPGSDIYFKASAVCHALRWLVGDEAFFRILRRWAYPDPALERTRDGSAVRFADTDGMIAIAERESGRDLDWFFEVYLRRAALPELVAARQGEAWTFTWRAPDDLPFPMPLPLTVGGAPVRLECPQGRGQLAAKGAQVEVDPQRWVLRR